jgi:hypothetical protein
MQMNDVVLLPILWGSRDHRFSVSVTLVRRFPFLQTLVPRFREDADRRLFGPTCTPES